MTAETDLLPLPEGYAAWYYIGSTHVYSADEMESYARANVLHHTAPLQAEIEGLREVVAEAREFRDKMANAIGNDQLRRFIEKHGEPVPLTTRMQAAEARAERLAEALALLERSLAVIQHDIDEIGGCDHSVGICCCELIHLADDIRAALEQENDDA